jgi:hypothetical protein
MNRMFRLFARQDVKSKQFPKESAFCDEIERLLADHYIEFKREHSCFETDARVDFYIPGCCVSLEAKVELSGTGFDRALGQLVRYKELERDRAWLVIPDDIRPTEGQRELVSKCDSRIIRFSDLLICLVQQSENAQQAYQELFARDSGCNSNSDHCARIQRVISARQRIQCWQGTDELRAQSGWEPLYEEQIARTRENYPHTRVCQPVEVSA